MSRVSFATLVAVFLQSWICEASAERHYGVSSQDRFLACAGSVWDKPVLASTQAPWPDESIVCPASSSELEAALERRGILTYDAGEYIVLVPERLRRRRGMLSAVKWQRLKVEIPTMWWRTISGSREPTPEEVAAITATASERARPPSITIPLGRGGVETETVRVGLMLDVHRLKPGVESVVAIWGVEHGVSRLVYGELVDGAYEFMWDSPLFNGFLLTMGYLDVNGDDTKEIVLGSTVGRDSQMLVVFDTSGKELTRQTECQIDIMLGFDETGGVCPVWGAHVDMALAGDGNAEIVVRNHNETFSLRLVDGVFSRGSPRN